MGVDPTVSRCEIAIIIRRFQPGEGTSRGFLCDYNPSFNPRFKLYTWRQLGAPSCTGSLASSRWMFSKWSYLSTQVFMGLFCSLLLASSFTFFWYRSLLIHSQLAS